MDGTTTLGTASAMTVNGSLSYSFQTHSLSLGTHTLTAVYNADSATSPPRPPH
jgi:hypothetical protein